MAQAAKIVESWGYDEVNVNCGCPSNSVKHGKFGAILMYDPHLVAKICKEMIKMVAIPVTVKCRIGVDDKDDFLALVEFIRVVSEDGDVKKFIVHARKAYLKGLNPK